MATLPLYLIALSIIAAGSAISGGLTRIAEAIRAAQVRNTDRL